MDSKTTALNTHRRALGRLGEDVAASYLQQHGYHILARNVRTPHGELDLVARKEDVVVFIEVKTRASQTFGFPEEAVTLRKQAHMLAAAEAYLAQHPESGETWQFDVIAIQYGSKEGPHLLHIENILHEAS